MEINTNSGYFQHDYKYLLVQKPFVIIDKDVENRRFAVMVENPIPNTNKDIELRIYDKVDENGYGAAGSYGRIIKMRYDVGDVVLKSVSIAGTKSSYYYGETINLHSDLEFSQNPFTPAVSDLQYE